MLARTREWAEARLTHCCAALQRHWRACVLERTAVQTFLFRLAKRRVWLARQVSGPAPGWRVDRRGRRWNVTLVPTVAYQAEIALPSLLSTAIVLVWVVWNCDSGGSSSPVSACQALGGLLVAGLAPLSIALVAARWFSRKEILTRIWDHLTVDEQQMRVEDRLARDYRQQLARMLDLSVRKLPYTWKRDTGEELLLRYAMKEYFHAPNVGDTYTVVRGFARLFGWFAAPAYLSLLGIYAQAFYLAATLPDCVTMQPSGFGFFGFLTTVWAVLSYAYSFKQISRILKQLDINPVKSSSCIPNLLQAASQDPPNLRSKIFLAAVPGVLAFIATFSLGLFEGLFS